MTGKEWWESEQNTLARNYVDQTFTKLVADFIVATIENAWDEAKNDALLKKRKEQDES